MVETVSMYFFSNSLARPSVSYVTMLLTRLIRFQFQTKKIEKLKNGKKIDTPISLSLPVHPSIRAHCPASLSRASQPTELSYRLLNGPNVE